MHRSIYKKKLQDSHQSNAKNTAQNQYYIHQKNHTVKKLHSDSVKKEITHSQSKT